MIVSLITILAVILMYVFLVKNIIMKFNNSRSISHNMKQSPILGMLNSKDSGYAVKLTSDGNVHRPNGTGIYGCPECHSSSLSCHVGWRREKLEDIKELWNLSFHSKLLGDTFNYCYSFFLKGECLMCHPTLFDQNKRKMPDYRRL